MESFLLVFIPLFVAIDPIGISPLFLGLTEGFPSGAKRRLALQAVATGLVVGLVFGVAGRWIFKALGITASDFRIGGGLLLLILSVKEIFGQTSKLTDGSANDTFIGVVPLGIPLIAGPAMITTILILFDHNPFVLIAAALVANLVITYGLFLSSSWITSKIGEAPAKAVAKVIAIFLAAIGIMMIRIGIETVLGR